MNPAPVVATDQHLSTDGTSLVTTRVRSDGSVSVVLVPVLGVKPCAS